MLLLALSNAAIYKIIRLNMIRTACLRERNFYLASFFYRNDNGAQEYSDVSLIYAAI